jgi:hypothetical protein
MNIGSSTIIWNTNENESIQASADALSRVKKYLKYGMSAAQAKKQITYNVDIKMWIIL